jgi:hypothetical protein
MRRITFQVVASYSVSAELDENDPDFDVSVGEIVDLIADGNFIAQLDTGEYDIERTLYADDVQVKIED